MPTLDPTAVSIPVIACTKCEALCKSRTKIINGRGPMDARVMVVGEAPGFEEDRFGKPFIGRSGQLLAKLLSEAGIHPPDVRLTNAVRCRPAGNRTPTAGEVANCRPYLLEEIKRVKPKVIIAAGGTAAAALLGVASVKVGGIAGVVLEQPETGIPIVTTYHPSWLMRGKWGMASVVRSHMEKARQVADGTLNIQPLEEARASAVVCRSLAKVKALADYLTSDEVSVIFADTETTGLDWMRDELLCISFSALDKDFNAIRAGFTVPIHVNDVDLWPRTKGTKKTPGRPKKPKTWRDGHIVPYWPEDDKQEKVVAELRRIFESGKPLAFQNAGFDIRILERSHDTDPDVDPDVRGAFGFHIAEHVQFDTMLMQRIINESLPYNETAMLTMYGDLPYYEGEVKVQTADNTRMDLGDNETVWKYAAIDSDGGARILPVMVSLIKANQVGHLHADMHIPMLRACWNMTRRGMYVDGEYFDKLSDRFRELTSEAEKAVMEAYGHAWFNLRAPAQVQNALFKVLNLPASSRKTKKSKDCDECKAGDCDVHDSTGRDALIEIKNIMRGAGQEPHPILDRIIRWKFLDKRKGTYIDGKDGDGGLVPYIRPSSRIHPEFFVNRTDTGRLAAYDPPVQTWPKDVPDEVLNEKKALRRTFSAPPGKVWMEIDWSQGELWVMAFESGDKDLLDLLMSGRDIHTHVARKFCEAGISDKFPHSAHNAELEDWEWRQEHDDLRKDAKVFVFGIDYGMTAMGIAERLVCDIPEAEKLRKFYLTEIFSKLESYFERIEGEIDERGYNEAWSGRRGHAPDKELVFEHSRNAQSDWEEIIRKQANMPIQTGLNDIHMYFHPAVEEDPTFSWYEIVLAVHDSLSGYVDEADQDTMVKRAWQLKERAESVCRNLHKPNGQPLDWPLLCEVSWGPNWGDLPNVLSSSGELTLVEE